MFKSQIVRKSLIVLAVLGLAQTALIGCGKSDDKSNTAPPPSQSTPSNPNTDPNDPNNNNQYGWQNGQNGNYYQGGYGQYPRDGYRFNYYYQGQPYLMQWNNSWGGYRCFHNNAWVHPGYVFPGYYNQGAYFYIYARGW